MLRAVVSEATAAGAVAVFKGGTSLSKGCRLVERFSEDVDILLVPPMELRAQGRHQILKRICRSVAAHFGLSAGDGEVIQSETGVKRNARFAYTSRFGAGPLSEGVLLEMGVRGGPQPRTTMPLRSPAAEHALRSGSDEGEFEEFAAVETDVLGHRPTLDVCAHDGHVAALAEDIEANSRRYGWPFCPPTRARLRIQPGLRPGP
jgi:hypothetical protein